MEPRDEGENPELCERHLGPDKRRDLSLNKLTAENTEPLRLDVHSNRFIRTEPEPLTDPLIKEPSVKMFLKTKQVKKLQLKAKSSNRRAKSKEQQLNSKS